MVRRLLPLALVVASLAFAPAIGATADTQGVTICNTSLSATIDPGLNLVVRDQTLKGRGTLSACTGGVVTSGTTILRARGQASCFSGTATGGALVNWDTGDQSRIKVTLDTATGELTGTVMSGLFAGDPVTADLSIVVEQGNCFFSPVTKVSATGTVTIG